jgi:hypothetical protein
VDDVLISVHADGRCDSPFTAHTVDDARSCAGFTLQLGVGAALDALAEYVEADDRTQQDADRQPDPQGADEDSDRDEDDERDEEAE